MLPGKVLQDWRIYRCPWSDVNAWSNVFSFVLEGETLSVFSVVLSFLVFASFSAGDGSERDALFCVCHLMSNHVRLLQACRIVGHDRIFFLLRLDQPEHTLTPYIMSYCMCLTPRI